MILSIVFPPMLVYFVDVLYLAVHTYFEFPI